MTSQVINDPRDPRILDPDSYGALHVSAPVLRGLMRTAGEHGAKIVNATDSFEPRGEVADISPAMMQETVHAMLATGSGERFALPDGAHDLVALRFVVDGAPLSIVYVEDYHSSYPALVDGHMTNSDDAIIAWLGDTDASEHPDLFPRQ